MNPVSHEHGQLYIVSAPSGAGKTSLVKALTAVFSNIKVAVSHTTRPKRDGEIHGVNYFFVTRDEFLALANASGFFEYAEVFGNFYGTSKLAVGDILAQGQDVILEIDWQGAQQVRSARPDAISIFIIPPSIDALQNRLQTRGQDKPEVIQRRLEQAAIEISHYEEFDFLIVNEDFDKALADLTTIFRCQHLTMARQQAIESKRLALMLSSLAD